MFRVLNKRGSEYLVYDDTDGTFEYASVLVVKTAQSKGYPVKFELETGDIVYSVYTSDHLDMCYLHEREDRYTSCKFLFQFFDLLNEDAPDYCYIYHYSISYRDWTVVLFVANNMGSVDVYWLGRREEGNLYCSGKFTGVLDGLKYNQKTQGYYRLSVDAFTKNYFEVVYTEFTEKYKGHSDCLFAGFKCKQKDGKLYVLRVKGVHLISQSKGECLIYDGDDNSFRHISILELKTLQSQGLRIRAGTYRGDFISEIQSCSNYIVKDAKWQTNLPFILSFLEFSGCENPTEWSHCFYDSYNSFDTIIFVVHGSKTDLVFLSQNMKSGVYYLGLLRDVFVDNPDKSYVNLDFRLSNTNKLRFSCLCEGSVCAESQKSAVVELLTDDGKFKVRLVE